MLSHVVIVGASLAGLRAAETLRQEEFSGRITVIGAEPHMPYDRPPLSKRLLAGDWEPERIALRKPDSIDELGVDWRTGVTAVGLDLDRRVVALADGSEVEFDGAIIATGAAPRRLPAQGDHGHVHELRTLGDSLALRAKLADGARRIVIIGAGFIGLETAATARQLGNEVEVLEGGPAPLMRALGAEHGAAVAAVHADHGVEIRCGVSVDGFDPSGCIIDGGTLVPADVIVVGIGVVPATEWLDDSGLDIRDGIVCASDLNVGTPLVYAAGDAVRWHNPLFDEEMRIEHWTNAAEQGARAASNLIAEAAGSETTPYAPVPFFWSEQYDRRIQFLGRRIEGGLARMISGSVAEREFAVLFGSGGRLTGVLGVNSPRMVMPFRKPLFDRITWDDALEFAAARS